jgi:hypothetical protein
LAKKVYDSVFESDVTVIRSSSGQGKSTLAWQTGYDLKEKTIILSMNYEAVRTTMKLILLLNFWNPEF